MAMTTFLFLRVTHDLLGLPRTAVTRGEPRIRPSTLIPVPVIPTSVGLPDRDIRAAASPPPACAVEVQ
jgi:hypothetical protein